MKIFVVEDDLWYADILEYNLQLNPDYEVEKYGSGKECIQNLYKNPSVITLDYALPDMQGEEVLKRVHQSNPEIPVIIISGQDDITTAVNLLKKGAYDYIVKDEETKDRLWATMKNLKENIKLREENEQLKEELGKQYKFSNVIKGNSPEITKLFRIMEKAIDNNITVSISGETGTGKELVAKSIHYNSTRKKFPFVAINVGAVPRELIESEMFGHEKGAFTGANTRRIGKFEEAHKGTIFLDEVAEMDLNMQTKLLRVLQEREVTRIGSNNAVKVDARVITATHKNLSNEVKEGNFRQDLYYRLLGLPIYIPPLRERKSDILPLAKFFGDNFARENKKKNVGFSTEAKKKLQSYPYPGNVRELRAVVELAVIMADSSTIEEKDITFDITDTVSDFLLQDNTLENYTVQIVKHFLDKYDHNALTVADKLDVGKSTIYRMIKKYQL